MSDQMIVSYQKNNDKATVLVDQEPGHIYVVIVESDAQGNTMGMASGYVASPTTSPVAGSHPPQSVFTMTLTVSENATTFTKPGKAKGYAFGAWANGTPFSWPSDQVKIT
jgi:hypothetical protein